MRKVAKTLVWLLAVSAIALIISGCSSDKYDGDVQTIVVGTSNDYPPYCYLNENGELAGFEKSILDAVDELLPQYKFKYEVFDFKNILASLDAKRIDIAAHQFGETEERLEKYIFSQEKLNFVRTYIVVEGDREDIFSLDDLRGKVISVPPASGFAYTIEEYNAEHTDNPILIEYYEATPDILASNMATGVVDATLLTDSDVKLFNAFFGTTLKITGDPLGDEDGTQFVFQKGTEELRDAVDEALRQLRASGKFAEIEGRAIDDFFAAASR
jgi:L-cystine transport system substrate-binding protein